MWRWKLQLVARHPGAGGEPTVWGGAVARLGWTDRGAHADKNGCQQYAAEAGASVARRPRVVQVLHVIKMGVDNRELRLGIVDGVFVVVVREVVEIACGVVKRDANRALQGVASLSLACALGIAGGCFDTATWPDATIPQNTCDVRHITKVWEWALENYHGAKGLTVDVRDAPVDEVFAILLPHAQQLISSGRGRMAASMGLDIEQVDQELAVLRAEKKTLETQLQQALFKCAALETQVEEYVRATHEAVVSGFFTTGAEAQPQQSDGLPGELSGGFADLLDKCPVADKDGDELRKPPLCKESCKSSCAYHHGLVRNGFFRILANGKRQVKHGGCWMSVPRLIQQGLKRIVVSVKCPDGRRR